MRRRLQLFMMEHRDSARRWSVKQFVQIMFDQRDFVRLHTANGLVSFFGVATFCNRT